MQRKNIYFKKNISKHYGTFQILGVRLYKKPTVRFKQRLVGLVFLILSKNNH